MARRRISRGFGQARAPRKKFAWIGGVQTGFTVLKTLSPTSAQFISFLDTRLAANSVLDMDFTIVRLRGTFWARSDQNTVTEDPFGAIGACVINGEAFDAGVASSITPWTESGDDRWFWHSYWHTGLVRAGASAGDGTTQSAFDMAIDNKAMRKVHVGDVIVFIIENVTSEAADFFFNVRTGILQ